MSHFFSGGGEGVKIPATQIQAKEWQGVGQQNGSEFTGKKGVVLDREVGGLKGDV